MERLRAPKLAALTAQGSDRRLYERNESSARRYLSVTGLILRSVRTDAPRDADSTNGHWCPIGARQQSTQINSALFAAWPEVKLLPTYEIRVFPREVVIRPLNQRVQGSSP
jgi:hypothetical protein